MIPIRWFLLATCLVPALGTRAAHAAWDKDGNPAVVALVSQYDLTLLADGAGGAFLVWEDSRFSTSADIYAQRVDAFGNRLWGIDGAHVCTAIGASNDPRLVSDGQGGVIITWEDGRGVLFDIYAQRLDGSGNAQWAFDGVAICAATGDQVDPELVSDGAGGAIIAWTDERNLGVRDVYAQRVGSNGTPQWLANGVAICTAANRQERPRITTDGAGGAIIVWHDERNGLNDFDIYAQRISGPGVTQWAGNGSSISTIGGMQYWAQLIPDGANGAFITWEDERGLDSDIYGQAVDAGGNSLWVVDGRAVCTAIGAQEFPRLISDGAGGVIFTWQDERAGAGNRDIFAQRFTGTGVPYWLSDGVDVNTSPQDQDDPRIVPDGESGAIIAWVDGRNGAADVYAQRIDAAGAKVWDPEGKPATRAPSNQNDIELVPDGLGGVVIAWTDSRATLDIYAQRLDERYGEYGHVEPVIASVNDVPGDQGGFVKVNWFASERDRLNQQFISHYSIWRATEVIPKGNDVRLVDPRGVGPDFEGPAYRIEGAQGSGFFWEWIANQDAVYLPAYSYTAATNFDSTASDPGDHYFQVISHSVNPFEFWPSLPDTGYSVDNLAPGAPSALVAQRTTGDNVLLEWSPSGLSEPDLRDYAVYRDGVSGVTPELIFFLDGTTDTTHIDDAATAGSPWYYVVTAVDVHENEGPPSNEAMVDPVATSIGGAALTFSRLTALRNAPNPFSASTEIRFGLPTTATVRLDVYDVKGGRVFSGVYGGMTAGAQSVRFDGRSLPSGVYFYRLEAAGQRLEEKITLAR